MALGAVLATAGIGRGAEQRIGVVDMQRALNECNAGRKAKDQVKGKFEKAQEDLKRQREDLDRRRDDYDKKALALSEDQRRDLEKDIEGRATEFKRKYEDLQRDLKRTDGELTSGIVEDLYGVVQQYGPEHGYSMILEASSGALLYSEKSNDITDEIIKIYDSSGPSKSRKGKKND